MTRSSSESSDTRKNKEVLLRESLEGARSREPAASKCKKGASGALLT